MLVHVESEPGYLHHELSWGAELRFPSTRSLRRYTHKLFGRYPARSINLVPRAILSSLRAQDRSSSVRVLDPFMGSGTTAIEAQLHGMTPIGVELDPFARLVATVSTRPLSPQSLEDIASQAAEIAETWGTSRPDPDFRPRLRGIERWFTEEAFADLLRIKATIYHVCAKNTVAKDFFRVVLADIIRPCSLAERQSLKPYISRKYTKSPQPVGVAWRKSFESQFRALEELSESVCFDAIPIQWLGDDATSFEIDQKVDVAITSPPYINALDYVRCIKLESSWVDCSDDQGFSELRKRQLGDDSRKRVNSSAAVSQVIRGYVEAVRALDQRRSAAMVAYFHGIEANLRCTWNALRPGGQYHMVVGNSAIRGVAVPTHLLIAEIAESIGYEWGGYYCYDIRDHRTSIPRGNQGGKITEEHVISLTRPTLTETM